MSGSRRATEWRTTVDHQTIEYSCNECGEEFEIFRDLAKHKRAAQCRGEEIDMEDVPIPQGKASLDASGVVKKYIEPPRKAQDRKAQLPRRNEKNTAWGAKKTGNIRSVETSGEKGMQDSPKSLQPKRIKRIKSGNTILKRAENLTRHVRIDDGSSQCRICQETFTNRNYLSRHCKLAHNGKTVQCQECKQNFRNITVLSRHMRNHTGEKPFVCDKCNQCFMQKEYLEKHHRTHTGEKPFGCKNCNKKFSQRGNLARHLRTHTGEKPFECDKCFKKFSQKQDLNIHYRIHTGVKPYGCKQCGMRFVQHQTLSKHYRLHTGEKPFRCDHCEMNFRQRHHLSDHIRSKHHMSVSRRITEEESSLDRVIIEYSCNECGEEFEIFRDLAKHKRAAQCRGEEIEEEPFFQGEASLDSSGVVKKSIEPPSKAQDRKAQLPRQNHVKNTAWGAKKSGKMRSVETSDEKMQNSPKSLHPKLIKRIKSGNTIHKRTENLKRHFRIDNGLKCRICQETFANRIYLSSHCKLAHNGKTVQCQECKHNFRNITVLSRHMRNHTGEKPFVCDKCNQCFVEKENLDRHYRTHTGEKPFGCDHCNKKFPHKGNLARHLRTHTGEKPYECDKCFKKFSQKQDLNIHYRIHSGEKQHACDKCAKKFSIKQNLMRHYRVHTGEKPFSCNQCEKMFSERSSLSKHIRSQHTLTDF